MPEDRQDPYESLFGDRAEEARRLLSSRVSAYSFMGLRFGQWRRTGASWRDSLKETLIHLLILVALAGVVLLLFFVTPLYQWLALLMGSYWARMLVTVSSLIVGSSAASILRANRRVPAVYMTDPPGDMVREAARDALLNDPAFRKAKFTPLRCLHCDYDLRESQGDRCVECGKALLGRASDAGVMRDLRLS